MSPMTLKADRQTIGLRELNQTTHRNMKPQREKLNFLRKE